MVDVNLMAVGCASSGACASHNRNIASLHLCSTASWQRALGAGEGCASPILGQLPGGQLLKGRNRFGVEAGGILTDLKTSPGAGGNAGSQV